MSVQSENRIVAFVSDLMFATRIESVANLTGYKITWVENAGQMAADRVQNSDRQLAEHLVGPGAELIDKLSAWHPVLIIFDLGNHQIPWQDWIAWIKSAPATRRIPVLCYGSHVDVETMRAARNVGADAVLARSRFVSDLPVLIEKYARRIDYAALEDACHAPLSDLALRGLVLFNQGEYFDAHEMLEEAWNDDQTPGRELYRAVLQIAVAYLQIERGNYNGAIKMFLRVRQWIDPLPDVCRGVDVATLRRDARMVHESLLALGPEGMANIDRSLLRPVQYELP